MKSLILSLLLALPGLGQIPGLPGIVPAEPGEPAERPPVAPPTQGIPDPDAIVIPNGQSFEYANLDGQTAANLYFKHTGKRVIVQSAAGAAEIKIMQPGPLTNGEIASILEKQLLMEGFALIPSGENEVKLVLSSGASGPADTGPRVLGPGDELPEGDEFVTYVMPLQYLKPDEALRAFQQVVGSYGPAGKVAAVPNAASVIINSNTALVRSLIQLKKQIDVPSAQVGTRFVDVVYADVEELSERLNEIFNNQAQQSSSAGVQRTQPTNPATPQIPGLNLPGSVAGAAGATSAGEDTPLNILPDTRTNRIFLMGRPVDLVFVEGLIEDFDSPTSSRNFLRHKLRYLPVAEFMPVAANAIERTFESGTASAGGAGGTGSTGGGSGSGGRNSGLSSSRDNSNTSNTSTGFNNNQGLNGGSGEGGGSRAALMQQNVETAPESMLVGKTLLVADKISNSIIVQGPPHHVEIVENLITELDQPSEQVAITAVFGRYDVSKGQNFGVDLANILDGVSGEFSLAGQNRVGVPSVIDPTTLTNLANVLAAPGASGNGLSLYGVLADEFGVFVNALETNSDFVAISRPTVFTTNNHEARISSGARIAVPTSTYNSGAINQGGISTNVEFRDVVLELAVLPLVNDKDEVTLQISLVRDDVGEDRPVGDLIVPDIITDEITTTVTVPNRSTIILGGLITETDKNSKTGIPILSSIPGIGRLFSRTVESVERQELVIMIHPSIIHSEAGLDDYQREYDADSELSPRARATMSGSGVLPDRGTIVETPVDDKGAGARTWTRQEPAPVGVAPSAPAAAQTREVSRGSMTQKRRR